LLLFSRMLLLLLLFSRMLGSTILSCICKCAFHTVFVLVCKCGVPSKKLLFDR
jgi:hypothetical protein